MASVMPPPMRHVFFFYKVPFTIGFDETESTGLQAFGYFIDAVFWSHPLLYLSPIASSPFNLGSCLRVPEPSLQSLDLWPA